MKMKLLLPSLRPLPASTTAKLFVTGASIGPVVDGLHNRCLLQYDFLPFAVGPLHSSWTVVPLLGVAYVVLGGLLPRLGELLLLGSSSSLEPSTPSKQDPNLLRNRAVQAVLTTVAIILLSAQLETARPFLHHVPQLIHNDDDSAFANVAVLSTAALLQWWCLDRSLVSLAAAVLAAATGPLAELPFVGHGWWHYLPTASDSFPLQALDPDHHHYALWTWVLGTADYSNLGLASITGPCYFAVTMDAIALGRWYDEQLMSSNVECETAQDHHSSPGK